MASWLDSGDFMARVGIDCATANLTVIRVILNGVQQSIAAMIQSPVLQVQRNYWLGGSATVECVLPERPVYLGDTTDLHVYVVTESYQTPTDQDEVDYQEDFDFEGGPDPLAGFEYRWSGVMQMIAGNVWPGVWWRGPSRLASQITKQPRVVRVVGLNVGWLPADIPAAILEAGYMEAAARYLQRRTGQGPLSSESWNGYSYSLSTQAMSGMDLYGAPKLVSPVATELLAPYTSACIAAMR